MSFIDELDETCSGLLIVLIGIPGSGKSTYAHRYSKALGIPVVSTDGIRGELLGDENDQNEGDLVFATAYSRIRKFLPYTGVIFDATNCNVSARSKIFEVAGSTALYVMGVVVDTPLEKCLDSNLKRDRNVPEEVIFKMHRQLWENPPSTDEGFDAIFDSSTFDTIVDGLASRYFPAS